MGRQRQQPGLAQQYARWLAALFIALELITAAAALGFIFLPMARRAADDLAGLMVLSAQTWSELPPETRPAFEQELERSHHDSSPTSTMPTPKGKASASRGCVFMRSAAKPTPIERPAEGTVVHNQSRPSAAVSSRKYIAWPVRRSKARSRKSR